MPRYLFDRPARRYDYLPGGTTNLSADRESGERLIATFPTMRTAVQENRRFMRRAVTHLAGQAGSRQFLDTGTGIPTSPTCTRSRRASRPSAGSSTSTTTQSCSTTPVPCSTASPRVRAENEPRPRPTIEDVAWYGGVARVS